MQRSLGNTHESLKNLWQEIAHSSDMGSIMRLLISLAMHLMEKEVIHLFQKRKKEKSSALFVRLWRKHWVRKQKVG